MHHEVVAPAAGVVRELAVAVGEQVAEGRRCSASRPADAAAARRRRRRARRPRATPSAIRPDLAELLERRRRAQRRRGAPRGGAKRHAQRPAHRARERRRPVRPRLLHRVRRRSRSPRSARGAPIEELIEKTPGRRDRHRRRQRQRGARGEARAPCSPTTTRCSPARRGSATTRRPTACSSWPSGTGCRSCCSPRAAAGGRATPTRPSCSTSIVPSFRTFARLSGLVPRVGIVSGRCFAGNAALLGCCDVVIATPEASIGMGGPAMIEGGGLGVVRARGGRADRRAGAQRRDRRASSPTRPRRSPSRKRFLVVLPGPRRATGRCADQALLRDAIPADPQRVHDVRAAAARRSPTTDSRAGAAPALRPHASSPRSRASRAGRSA